MFHGPIMMPRRPSNRADIEADVVEDPVVRYCKRVAGIIILIVILVAAFVALGSCVAYFVVEDKEAYGAVILPILFGGMSLFILCVVIYLLWKSDLREVRSDLRRCYRNLRHIIHLIRLPAFCTRYLRGRDRRVRVNTIFVRPEPTPSYAVADCAVQIETPSPIRPLQPLHAPYVPATESLDDFVNYHRPLPNMNILHED